MSINAIESTRKALPDHLHNTFDDTISALYGCEKPRGSVRMDVCVMCVESFDKIVSIIADSPYCIADILQTPHDGSCKAEHRRDCRACIRSHVYRLLLGSS